MSDQPDQTPETPETPEPTAITVDDRVPVIPPELPVLPLRDTVLFPNSFMPLAVARESSVRLIDEAIANGKLIGVFTQRDPALDEPLQADLYAVGTATHIHKMFRLPDGSLRLKLTHNFVTDEGFLLQTEDTAKLTPVPGLKNVFQQSTEYKITGGTGRYAAARGTFINHGEADLGRGLLTLRYDGRICGLAP